MMKLQRMLFSIAFCVLTPQVIASHWQWYYDTTVTPSPSIGKFCPSWFLVLYAGCPKEKDLIHNNFYTSKVIKLK